MYWSILIDLVIFCLDPWVREWCENEQDVLCCDVMLRDKVVEWRELCLSKLYLIYMICISMLSHFSLLARNVMTHSPCVICVWILWWSWTLCLWEQIVRWMVMENLMLKDAGTQCSNRMWYWGIGFYINCMKSWTTLFWAEMIYYLFEQILLWC